MQRDTNRDGGPGARPHKSRTVLLAALAAPNLAGVNDVSDAGKDREVIDLLLKLRTSPVLER